MMVPGMLHHAIILRNIANLIRVEMVAWLNGIESKKAMKPVGWNTKARFMYLG